MAMNLRLDDDDSALLKALAEAEAKAEMLDRWGRAVDRLGRA